MNEAKASKQVLIDNQNQFRGLIAAFKSQKFAPKRSDSPVQGFRSGVRELLLEARATLHVSQYDHFITWVRFQTAKQLPELSKHPIGYDELTGIFVKAPVVNLEQELLWVSSLLKADAALINKFRIAAKQVECYVFSGDFELALNRLEDTEKELGVTLWSVQLRIAVEHLTGGLERQKRYTAKVRSIYKNGLLPFITYNTSVRNEDRTTYAKYLSDVRLRIDTHKYYDSAIKNYVRYRLTNGWPKQEIELADIIRVEQSHATVDIYETFVALVQELTRRSGFKEARATALRCVQSLDTIDDHRLLQAAILLGDKSLVRNLPQRKTEILDNLLSGQFVKAVRKTRNLLISPEAVDPWQVVYASFVYATAKRAGNASGASPNNLARLLGRIFSRSDESDAYAQVSKLTMNLRGLPAAEGLREVVTQICSTHLAQPWRPWLVSLNSPNSGIEDHCSIEDYHYTHDRTGASTPTENLWLKFFHPNGNTENQKSDIGNLFRSAGFIREGDWLKVLETINYLALHSNIEAIRATSANIALSAHYMVGNRDSVIGIIADEGARSISHQRLLPVEAALASYTWSDYKAVKAPLAPLIALYLLWTANEEEATLSLLRFGTGVFLRTSGIQRPSKLYDQAQEHPAHQLIYFLKVVCVPQIIDASRVLKGTRAVAEERQAICAALRLLDDANSDIYEVEVMSISNQLALDDGRWIVDRTRIHVDTGSLTRWATKALSEDFARYRDLLGVSLDTLQAFDDVIRELREVSSTAGAPFIPDDEADAVLVSMLGRLKEEFLNNPSFGLDFYLSQRIRHQSFVGLIRGPMEFANIITTRESETGAYHPNEFWTDKFQSLSKDKLEMISEAFARFAAKFDDALIEAKDKRFQILSDEKPEGLLYLEFSVQLINVARMVARLDVTLDDFLATTIAVIWGSLEPSLNAIRTYITQELKNKIVSIVDELRASVRKIGEDDPAFLGFDMEIGKRCLEVQRALDDAAVWFTRADVEAQNRIFKLDQVVKIAIDSALKSQRAFDPVISNDVIDGEMQMRASALVFVHDVLFVALDNVRAHSNLKRPHVGITVLPNSEEGTCQVPPVHKPA